LGGSIVERHSQGSEGLQRFFSTFPAGWPGLGLLLLRTIAGGAAATQGGIYLAHATEPTAGTWVLGLVAIIGGLAVIAGFFTPGAAVAMSTATLVIAATWIPPAGATFRMDRVAAILVIVDGLALALLGPGAHSIDAYRFGRREIVLPHDLSRR